MDAELRGMVMSFRIPELQALLTFSGRNNQGRKHELQARALDLVVVRDSNSRSRIKNRKSAADLVIKIKELFRISSLSRYGQPLSLPATESTAAVGATASSMVAASRYVNDSGNYSGTGGFKQGRVESIFRPSTLQSLGYQRVLSMDGQHRPVPICPDVKLKELPFYDIRSVLIKPTSLMNKSKIPKQEAVQSFYLSQQQAAEIASSREILPTSDRVPRTQTNVQVQIRFCLVDTEGDSGQELDDSFPQDLMVKMNGRPIQLPHPIPSSHSGVKPKRPSRPLNVTNSVKCSPVATNHVTVQWVADKARNFAVSVSIVQRLTADELFSRLKNKIQPADFTRGLIEEIFSPEEEDLCAPTSIVVSVACPLGKNRMAYPCRGATTCKHLQCFDANLFLRMNEKKPSFICPVCNKHLKFNDLCIDGYFMDVIKELSVESGNDIELYPGGRWESTMKAKKETGDVSFPTTKRMKPVESDTAPNSSEAINLEDDDNRIVVEEDTATATQTDKNSSKPTAVPEVVDLID